MRSSTRRGVSALAALALVAGSLLAAVPAQAATPVSPDDAAYFEGESVTLTWNADTTSNGLYLVRWWTLGGGGIQTRQVAGTTTQLTDLADGTYYWSVAHYTYSSFFGHRPTLVNPTRTFTIEAAPLVSLSPLPGTIGPEGSLVVVGSAKDSSFAWAELYLDNAYWGSLSTTAIGPLHVFAQTLNFAGTPLAPGEHSLRVDAEDAGERPGSATATFWVDGDGPTAAIVSPVDGGYVKGGADVPVSMSFSELSTWSLWADGDAAGSGLGLNPSVDVAVDPSIWTDGTEHTLAVEASDLYGNASAPPPITVTVDGLAPDVELTRPGVATLPVGDSFLARATATDAGSGVASVKVFILANEPGSPCSVVVSEQAATLSAGKWTATVDTSLLSEGTYCVEAMAADAVGLKGYSDLGYVEVDHGAPGDVTLHAPLDGSILPSKNVTLGWNAPTGPAETLTYEYELGKLSELLGDGSLKSSARGTGINALTKLVNNLANGKYYWHARAVDEAGNRGAWSEVWSLKIAAPAPPAPPNVTTTETVEPTPTPEPTETTEPTPDATEEPEETDEPAAPTDEPEASGDSADAGFPVWVALVVIVLVLGGLAFFIRFFFFRRA